MRFDFLEIFFIGTLIVVNVGVITANVLLFKLVRQSKNSKKE